VHYLENNKKSKFKFNLLRGTGRVGSGFEQRYPTRSRLGIIRVIPEPSGALKAHPLALKSNQSESKLCYFLVIFLLTNF